jgi:outer membrane protein OmpA-like peptidoglycan-associated protein
MNGRKNRIHKLFSLLLLGFAVLFPAIASAADPAALSIQEARIAIEQAVKAGAELQAAEDLAAAKSWLSQAEKAHASATSLTSIISTSRMKKEREEEIVYLAGMAKIKGLTAETRTRKFETVAELKDARKDLADYQNALAFLKEKMTETEKAKAVQAKAELERKQLEEAKKSAAEMEARKRKELEEAQRKALEIEALKQKELAEARSEEVRRAAERQKETAEVRTKEAELSAERVRQEMEMKASEERLLAEKKKLAAVEARLQELEREKAMLSAAGRIPKVTAESGDKKIVMTILAIHLFSPANDLTPPGKETLNQVGGFLKAYPGHKAVVRGHTDARGSQAANQAVSEKRAMKVREYLVAYQNIPAGGITAEGMGPNQPVATNASEAGRALNRRIEVIVLMGE